MNDLAKAIRRWTEKKTTRRSTSCGVLFTNNCFMYASSRNQKVISLSSFESELHSLVSSACDGIYIRACAMFVLNGLVEHIQYTDAGRVNLRVDKDAEEWGTLRANFCGSRRKRQTNPFHFTLLPRFTMWQTLQPKLCHVNDSFTFCIHVVWCMELIFQKWVRMSCHWWMKGWSMRSSSRRSPRRFYVWDFARGIT